MVVQWLWGELSRENSVEYTTEAFIGSFTNLFHTQGFDPEASHFFPHINSTF